MICTRDLDGARWQYKASLTMVENVKSELLDSLNHLKYIKKLVKKGIVKQSAYQSYKATTAKYRSGLVEAVKMARSDKHKKHRIYDNLQKEYNKQNAEDTILQDALVRLSPNQREVLKEYFRSLP